MGIAIDLGIEGAKLTDPFGVERSMLATKSVDFRKAPMGSRPCL